MTDEMTALLSAGHTPTAQQRSDSTIRLDVSTPHGNLRLVSAPISAPEAKPVTSVQPKGVSTDRRHRHRPYVASRCYDIAVAMLLLLSAGVALYRLIWMGQL